MPLILLNVSGSSAVRCFCIWCLVYPAPVCILKLALTLPLCHCVLSAAQLLALMYISVYSNFPDYLCTVKNGYNLCLENTVTHTPTRRYKVFDTYTYMTYSFTLSLSYCFFFYFDLDIKTIFHFYNEQKYHL